MSSVSTLHHRPHAGAYAEAAREQITRVGTSARTTVRELVTFAVILLIGFGLIAVRYWIYMPAHLHFAS
jgi:hypothetical protein